MCECVLVSGIFPKFFARKNLVFVGLRTFALVEAEKIECEVILSLNEKRGEIIEFCVYQTNFVFL